MKLEIFINAFCIQKSFNLIYSHIDEGFGSDPNFFQNGKNGQRVIMQNLDVVIKRYSVHHFKETSI